MSGKNKLLQIAVVTLLLNMTVNKVAHYLDGLGCSVAPLVVTSLLSDAKYNQCKVHRSRNSSEGPTVIWSLGKYFKTS